MVVPHLSIPEFFDHHLSGCCEVLRIIKEVIHDLHEPFFPVVVNKMCSSGQYAQQGIGYMFKYFKGMPVPDDIPVACHDQHRTFYFLKVGYRDMWLINQ